MCHVLKSIRLTETYNVESLIVYPGFNSPVPEGVGDDHRLLRMPPLMSHQQLDFATSTMKTPKPVPYKRIKISSPGTERQAQDPEEDSGPTTKELLQMVESREKTTDQVSPAGRLIRVGVGVPESYKTKKPPLEKWSENNSLSELIYFENLPNYTGVFDRMRTVLGGVRSKLFGSSSAEESGDTPLSQKTPATTGEIDVPEAPVIHLNEDEDHAETAGTDDDVTEADMSADGNDDEA